MSTLQLRQISTKLGHFKSSNYIERAHHLSQTRKRNNSSNLTAYQSIGEQYNRVDSQNYQSKMLLETNLPDIPSKKISQKRSSLLEMWLDQALDPQQGQQTRQSTGLRVQVDKTGPLRTVQKFQIDKKYLKSQNISNDAIEKIYNSLYVYTYGINNTFQEILKSTKASQHAEKKIVNNFWKAFIKLLQGCTSFRTSFQIIEEGYVKNIAEVKDAFVKREEVWLGERAILEQQNIKLLKKINDQSYLLSKITSDYNISQATLQLTDQAFNEEVNLRLKFEEKVNAMFSSYQELRVKYDRLIMELHVNKEQFSEFKRVQIQLRQDLEQTTIRLEQTRKQLARAQQVIVERDQQLSLKRQEIFQLQSQMKISREEYELSQDEIRKILNKANTYKLLSEQYKAQATSKAIILSEVQKRLSQQDMIIMSCRETNEKIYNQLEESGRFISQLQKQIIQSQVVLKQAITQKQESLKRTKELQNENQEFVSVIQSLEKELSLTKDELAIKNTQISKNQDIIGDLHAVNSKFQTLYLTTNAQKKKMEFQMQQAIHISERFKQQMQGMKMLLQSKTVELEQANVKLENQREVFRSKISGQRQEVENKEQQILQLHNKQLEDKELVNKCQKQAEACKKLVERYRSQILNLSAEIVQNTLRIDEIDRQRISKYQIIRKLEEEIQSLKEQLLQSKQHLSQKQGVISSAIGQSQAESEQLRQLLSQYRQSREKKVNHIHPMLYEDCIEQINRLQQKLKQLSQLKVALQSQNNRLREELESKTSLCEQKQQRIVTLTSSLVNKEARLQIILQKQSQVGAKLQQLAQEYKVYKATNESKKEQSGQKLKEVQAQNSAVKKQNAENKATIMQKNTEIQKLKEQNRELCHLARQNEGEIQLLQQRISQLQDQAKKGSSRIGTRTQQVARKKTPLQTEKDEKSESKYQGSLQTIPEIKKEEGQHQKVIEPLPASITNLINKKITFDKEVQTEKRFNHSNKFQLSSGTQALNNQLSQPNSKEEAEQNRLQQKKFGKRVEANGRQQQKKKVQAGEFKKALKFTFMRR